MPTRRHESRPRRALRFAVICALGVSCRTDALPTVQPLAMSLGPLAVAQLVVRIALAAPPAPEDVAPGVERYRGMSLDALLDAMAHRPIVRVIRRYDSTSVTYHLELEGGLEIAFKPALIGEREWWRHEVIGYHLGHLLGLGDRVTPAVARRVPLAALGSEAVGESGIVTAADDPSSVPGAALFWLPVLNATHLETPERRASWEAWLDASRAIPTGDDAALARDVSDVLVFDYLQANDDRWNEANVAADEFDRLTFRDNNVGWFLNALQDLTWCDGPLHRTQRFSRALVAALERASAPALAAEIGPPGRDGAALGRRSLAAYERRRAHVLAMIRELRERYGDAAVMAFP